VTREAQGQTKDRVKPSVVELDQGFTGWPSHEGQTGKQPRSRTMLILTRKVGETIVINDTIRVTVLQIKGNQVRIGIEAPKNVSVHRQEIQERIAAQAEVAA